MPYTHGLAGALAGASWSRLRRARCSAGGGRAALVLGVCVFSHWLLDAPMHTPDMPLLGDGSPKVGLGLWRYRSSPRRRAHRLRGRRAHLAARDRRACPRPDRDHRLPAALIALTLATPFMPPPANPVELAFSMLAAYAVLAGAAAWIDRARRPA